MTQQLTRGGRVANREELAVLLEQALKNVGKDSVSLNTPQIAIPEVMSLAEIEARGAKMKLTILELERQLATNRRNRASRDGETVAIQTPVSSLDMMPAKEISPALVIPVEQKLVEKDSVVVPQNIPEPKNPIESAKPTLTVWGKMTPLEKSTEEARTAKPSLPPFFAKDIKNITLPPKNFLFPPRPPLKQEKPTFLWQDGVPALDIAPLSAPAFSKPPTTHGGDSSAPIRPLDSSVEHNYQTPFDAIRALTTNASLEAIQQVLPTEIHAKSSDILRQAEETLINDINTLFGQKGFLSFGAELGVDSLDWKDITVGFKRRTVAGVLGLTSFPRANNKGQKLFGTDSPEATFKMREYLKGVVEKTRVIATPGESVEDYVKRAVAKWIVEQERMSKSR